MKGIWLVTGGFFFCGVLSVYSQGFSLSGSGTSGPNKYRGSSLSLTWEGNGEEYGDLFLTGTLSSYESNLTTNPFKTQSLTVGQGSKRWEWNVSLDSTPEENDYKSRTFGFGFMVKFFESPFWAGLDWARTIHTDRLQILNNNPRLFSLRRDTVKIRQTDFSPRLSLRFPDTEVWGRFTNNVYNEELEDGTFRVSPLGRFSDISAVFEGYPDRSAAMGIQQYFWEGQFWISGSLQSLRFVVTDEKAQTIRLGLGATWTFLNVSWDIEWYDPSEGETDRYTTLGLGFQW